MPKNDTPPPPPPPTCGACIRSDHEACHTSAWDADGQRQPCSCPCGGGTEGAWVE